MGKLKALIVLVLLAVFVATNPKGAASAALLIAHATMTLLDGVGAFVATLSGGAR